MITKYNKGDLIYYFELDYNSIYLRSFVVYRIEIREHRIYYYKNDRQLIYTSESFVISSQKEYEDYKKLANSEISESDYIKDRLADKIREKAIIV